MLCVRGMLNSPASFRDYNDFFEEINVYRGLRTDFHFFLVGCLSDLGYGKDGVGAELLVLVELRYFGVRMQ